MLGWKEKKNVLYTTMKLITSVFLTHYHENLDEWGEYQTRRKRTFAHLLGIGVSYENHSKYIFFGVIFS